LSAEVGSGTTSQVVDAVEKVLAKRGWLSGGLWRFEEEYGPTSREICEAWKKSLLPEPGES